MVAKDSPDLIGDIRNRGDRTTWPPPPGQAVKEGTLQGGSVDYPSQLPAGRPAAGALLERRGDLSGTYPTLKPHDPYGGQRGRDQKASWDWLSFAATMPADNIPVASTSANQLIESGRQIFYGGVIINAATTAGFVEVRDGMDATGGLLTRLILPATTAANLSVPYPGLLCEIGLFLVVSAVTVTGSLWVTHLWKYPFTPPGE